MPNADDGDSKPVLTCSICGKSQHDISDIAGSPAVFVRDFICDECVGSELARLESPALAFSKDLDQTLHRALTIAQERGEPHAIEEHLLLSVIDDPDAAVVMRGCNLDLEAARQRFIASLADRAEAPLAEGADTTPSAAFQRIIQRAVIHVQSAKCGGLVTGTDVLVAAFAEPPAAATRRSRDASRSEQMLIEQLWVRLYLIDHPALSRAFHAKRRSTANCELLSFHCS